MVKKIDKEALAWLSMRSRVWGCRFYYFSVEVGSNTASVNLITLFTGDMKVEKVVFKELSEHDESGLYKTFG